MQRIAIHTLILIGGSIGVIIVLGALLFVLHKHFKLSVIMKARQRNSGRVPQMQNGIN